MQNIFKRFFRFTLLAIAAITCSIFAQAQELYLIELLDEDSDEEAPEQILSIAERITDIVEKDFCEIMLDAQSFQSCTASSGNFLATILQQIHHKSDVMMAIEELDSPLKELFPSLAVGFSFRGVIDGKENEWTVKVFRKWPCLAAKFQSHRHLCGSAPTFGNYFMPVEDFDVTGAQYRIFRLEKNHDLVGKKAKIRNSDGIIRYVTQLKDSSPCLVVLELEDSRFIFEALEEVGKN
jgi:hypothetical protein